jgi:hypothetical protein
MAKVTISVEGEPDDVRNALIALLRGGPLPGDAMPPLPSTADLWSREDLSRFWMAIQPEARRVLAEVAKHPAGAAWDDVRAALDLSGPEMAGRMSSVGHIMRKIFGGRPAPVQRDYVTRQYTMDPAVAREILRLAHDIGL